MSNQVRGHPPFKGDAKLEIISVPTRVSKYFFSKTSWEQHSPQLRTAKLAGMFDKANGNQDFFLAADSSTATTPLGTSYSASLLPYGAISLGASEKKNRDLNAFQRFKSRLQTFFEYFFK
ncbi:MAG: hypothetical protein U0176_15815 [Bacteroidia bacterium]